MSPKDTVFTYDDISKLDVIIQNTKDPKARKNLIKMKRELEKKLRMKEEQEKNKTKSLKTIYLVAIPFILLFAAIGVYYWTKKENKSISEN